MNSIPGKESDSTGSDRKGTSLEPWEIPEHDPWPFLTSPNHGLCDSCPFAAFRGQLQIGLKNLHNEPVKELDYEAVKESAERGHCQACAGIVKFLNAQKLEPIKLSYRYQHMSGITVDLIFASRGDSPTYEFFVQKEEPAGGETLTRPDHYLDYGGILPLCAPSGDTSNKAAFDTLKRWISRCEEYHTLCQPTADKRLPHRVLEIESCDPLRIRLVEDCTRHEKYACLSHRWGEQTRLNSLNKQNLDLYQTQIPEDKFHPLVRDAIAATIQLNLRFIWIDCYCIIQDDINDWEVEAAEMALIYENAFLTISATFSEDGCSMFSKIPREFEAFQVTEIRGSPVYIRKQLPHPCMCDHSLRVEALCGPSLTRAWVFQERLLSKRFIHFTSSEIFWECRERTWCECDSKKDDWILRRMHKARTIDRQDWGLIAAQYNDTQLSFEKDRLPALAGVARRYAKLTGGWTYLAGLWKETLPAALTWYKDGWAEPRPLEQSVPTWSWASLPRGKNLFTHSSKWSEPSARCEIKPTEADVYMSAQWTAEITVEGPMLDLRIYKESGPFLIGRHGNIFLRIWADFKIDPDDETKFRAVPNGSRCLLLLLFDNLTTTSVLTVDGIVLLQQKSSALEVPRFERIGYFPNNGIVYVDKSDEYAEFCGGIFPPWANRMLPWTRLDRTTFERLLDRAKTRRVTLV